MERIKIGIEGLDSLFGDGIPKGSNILVFGKPGTGKTILGLEFIYNGASKFNEPGVYVTMDQSKEAILNQCRRFGWSIDKLIKNNKICIVPLKADDIDRDIANRIIKEIKHVNAKRLVLDTIALLSLDSIFLSDSKFSFLIDQKVKVVYDRQQFIYTFISIINKMNLTTFYLTFSSENETSTRDGISEYLCDGLINLRIRKMGKASLRTLEIIKMRQSSVTGGLHGFNISDHGLEMEEKQ